MIARPPISRRVAAVHCTIVRALDALCTTSDVLPRGTESATSASKQAFLLLLPQIIIQLLLIQLRHAEKHDEEHDGEDAEESELRPEIDEAEERKVDIDAVEEGGHDRGRADEVGDRVVGALGAWPDGFTVVAAVRLLVRVVAWAVAEGLGAEGCVLWCYD